MAAVDQWTDRLLPGSYTCQADTFTLAGWLEPAATIGGDTFDYSLERDQLHLSVTDAMGHGVAAALIATVCVGSLRSSRRAGASLPGQAAAADTAVRGHLSEGFAAGLLGRVELATGVLSLIDAGHVLPFLQRGESIAEFRWSPTCPSGSRKTGSTPPPVCNYDLGTGS